MSIKEQILKSIEIIVDAKLRRYKADKTLLSVVVSVENNGKYPDLNNKSKYPLNGATSIITIAEEYGETLGATGRLMTYEEAQIFKDVNSTILYGKYESGKFINYWLGSAYSDNSVWYVYGGGAEMGGQTYYRGGGDGVRPVIKISKSLIK